VLQMGEGEVGRNLDTTVLDQPFDHRSVYLPVIRGIIPEQLRLFDFPEPSNVQGLRDSNTTPTQSLFLMNSDFAIRVAKHFAERLLSEETLIDDAERIRHAYLLCFASEPTHEQIDRDLGYIQNVLAQLGDGAETGQELEAQQEQADRDRRRLAWTTYCQSLLASAKFRFID